MRLLVTTVYPRFTYLIISRFSGGYTVTLLPQGVGITPTQITSYQGTEFRNGLHSLCTTCRQSLSISTYFWRTGRTHA